ncbi:MAG TPA: peptide ABC transporter substrate-binding protein [Chloroflexota bacterium]|nr:peptide ABC transporter substrate-binding protein [Chloroflexota bacterium]
MAVPDNAHRAYVERMRMRRRQMLKAFAAGGGIGLASFLTACTNSQAPAPTQAPAATTAPAPTQAPAATTAPAATQAPAATTAPAATPTAATAAPTAATQPTAAPAGAPQALAGALHLNEVTEPDTMDPGRASVIGEIEIIMRVFSNSYTFDSKAQMVLDQAAAPPSVSSDGKTITVKLKPGLVWSDGKPLTAKDFVYGTLRQLNPVVAGEYAFTLYALEGAEKYNTADPKKVAAADLQKLRDAVGISAPDDTTLIYKLTDPAPWFLSVLCTWNGLPVRKDLIEQGGAAEDNQDWTKDPARYIGNGAYILAKHEPSVQFVFNSNPKYVRGEPPVKTVQYYMIKDNTVAFNAYKAGNLDVMDGRLQGVGPLIKPAVDGDATLKKQFSVSPGSCSFYIGFNTTLKPFDNPKVRQAFAAAFDRKTFAEQVEKGLALPADQFLPPGFPGNYTDIPTQKFDPATAQKLLADAGFAGGAGLPPIKFTFSNTDTNKLISQAAQAMFLQNLKVNVQLDPVEPTAFSALVKKQETTPQMFRLGWCQDYPDPQDWYSTVFQSSSTVSHTGWKNADFDKATQQADIETDPKKRDALYRQAATILNQEAPVMFTHYDVDALLIKPTVQGYKADPFEYFFGQHSLYDMKLGSP